MNHSIGLNFMGKFNLFHCQKSSRGKGRGRGNWDGGFSLGNDDVVDSIKVMIDVL